MDEIQELLNLPEIVKDFDLKNIRKVLEKLGEPHKYLKAVHTAGTNGKGSVCAMVSQGLIESGYKTGLYTSPHLSRVNERIRVGGEEISDEELCRILRKVKKAAADSGIMLTFFEFITAAAFVYFKEQDVDYAVLEVGMGGRLDATNICKPVVSVITNISIDHKMHLGETIEEIAKEKAGIIKENGVIVTGCNAESMMVIKKECDEKGCRIIIPEPREFELSLKGGFQQRNASIAYNVLKELGVDDMVITEAFKKVIWPGRFEFVDNLVVLDCAHNVAAIDVLIEELGNIDHERLIVVIGMMKDKEIDIIAEKLGKVADKIFLTKPKIHRSADTMMLSEYFKEGIEIEDVKEAVESGVKEKTDVDLLLVTGSIFTVAEARESFF